MSVYQRLHFRILGILGIGLPSDQLHNQLGWRPHKKVAFAEKHDYIYIYMIMMIITNPTYSERRLLRLGWKITMYIYIIILQYIYIYYITVYTYIIYTIIYIISDDTLMGICTKAHRYVTFLIKKKLLAGWVWSSNENPMHNHTGWCPPVINWLVTPSKFRHLRIIHQCYYSYLRIIHQLS